MYVALTLHEESAMLKMRHSQNEDERTGAPLKAFLLIPTIGIAAYVFAAFGVTGSNLARDERVTTMTEVYLTADAIATPDIVMTCAGSMDANGDECDIGLEPTLATATMPSLGRLAGPALGSALAMVGAAIGKPLDTGQSTTKQADPENPILGCAGGTDFTGCDCM